MGEGDRPPWGDKGLMGGGVSPSMLGNPVECQF